MSYSCKSPTNDFQQCEAYKWEDELTLWASPRDTDRELRKIMAKACALYRVPVPTLFVLSSDKGSKGTYLPSNYDPDTHTIRIRPRHRTGAIILHETAHAIVDWIMGPYSMAAHGKLWLGVYIELLARLKVLPRDVLMFSAKARGLKFSRNAAPGVIRKRHKKMVRDAKRLRRLLKFYA